MAEMITSEPSQTLTCGGGTSFQTGASDDNGWPNAILYCTELLSAVL